jgi:hypothetical protein
MKPLVLALFVLLVFPAPALADATTIAMREVPLHGGRTLASTAPRFDLVGLHWRGSGTVLFRTHAVSGSWSSWRPAAPEAEDGPDIPAQPGWRIGNPYWTGESDAIAYHLRGRVTRLRAYFVWSPVDGVPPRALSIAGSPQIIPRSGWGADESIRRAPPRYAMSVQYALVHHTAGTNDYSRAEAPAIVRGIEVYHVKGNGWNDIGYNFLVDKYGDIFEGRYGGVDKNVIGAHAEGFNTGSTGVAVLGTYTTSPPPAAALTALENLLAWRLDIAHVDPLSTLTVMSGGNPRFPVGAPVLLRAISGHRDTGFTDCPGNALYAKLGTIAEQAAALGLPKLYAPVVQGNPGGLVTFRGTLSEPLPWTITVTDPKGIVVGTASGQGTDIEWTWDATHMPQAKYTWTMSAGPTVTPATGSIGAAPVPLALKDAIAKPPALAGGTTVVSYTLSTNATVTATLRAADGRQLSTLFQQQVRAGAHTFTFSAQAIPDGRYTIVLSATDGKKTVSASVGLVVDRTVSAYAVTPSVFSPNGDGRNDTVSFAFHLARAAQVRIDLKRGSRVAATILSANDSLGDQALTWDGQTSVGRIPDASYSAVLTSVSAIGTTTHTLPLRVDTVAPKIRALSFRRLVFRISEPAIVTVIANGRRYVRNERAGIFSLHIGRLARRVAISAIDAAGNVSRTLRFH